MKKTLLTLMMAFAAFATIMLTSCKKEDDLSSSNLGCKSELKGDYRPTPLVVATQYAASMSDQYWWYDFDELTCIGLHSNSYYFRVPCTIADNNYLIILVKLSDSTSRIGSIAAFSIYTTAFQSTAQDGTRSYGFNIQNDELEYITSGGVLTEHGVLKGFQISSYINDLNINSACEDMFSGMVGGVYDYSPNALPQNLNELLFGVAVTCYDNFYDNN